ncbi:MAG: addiction module protein [Thermoanaerobaculia bacterium]
MTTEDLRAAALKLPLKQRADLAGELLKSLDELSEEECSELWAREVDRRIRAAREHKTLGIPGEEVLARARKSVSS